MFSEDGKNKSKILKQVRSYTGHFSRFIHPMKKKPSEYTPKAQKYLKITPNLSL